MAGVRICITLDVVACSGSCCGSRHSRKQLLICGIALICWSVVPKALLWSTRSTWWLCLCHRSLSKICSYEGACLRRRSGCTRFKHYSWYDPSNYVYAQMWYLLVRYSQSTLRKAHLFNKSDVRLKCRHVVAQRMLDIHDRACVRWPTVSPLKHYNRLGDLLEFVLGRCYCDARGRLNSMLHIISDIAFWVRDIEHAVWHNQLTQPRSRTAADTCAKGMYWIYEMQRHNEVQCRNYRYSREEEKFDKWASDMKYCFQWIHKSF